jgi:hypothetical protein
MNKKKIFYFLIFLSASPALFSQIKPDSIFSIFNVPQTDTVLRIKNLNPYFNLHVDSTLNYPLQINKELAKYYWFLKNSPVGLKINKDNGELSFKAEKSYFLSGRLKYDYEYKVELSVQNLEDPAERLDTSFRLLFYNTEIIPSKINPTVTNTLFIDEGDTVNFKLQCDNGNFPIEYITYFSNYPVKSLTPVTKCNDEFTWYAPFDFVKPTDKGRQKKLQLYFIGTNKFNNKDTAIINIVVNENINYPQQVIEFERLQVEIEKYVVQLKSSFRLVDQKVKKTKSTRTAFDMGSATTALGGTVLLSIPGSNLTTVGKILPSVGVTMVPVKEAVAPSSNVDQNTATLIRSSIKRLEYLLAENTLVGERDPDILNKSRKLKDELKQTQIQLIDIPIAEENVSNEELDEYFNNPKVNKKYQVKHSN